MHAQVWTLFRVANQQSGRNQVVATTSTYIIFYFIQPFSHLFLVHIREWTNDYHQFVNYFKQYRISYNFFLIYDYILILTMKLTIVFIIILMKMIWIFNHKKIHLLEQYEVYKLVKKNDLHILFLKINIIFIIDFIED